jgi:hypothetical protein
MVTGAERQQAVIAQAAEVLPRDERVLAVAANCSMVQSTPGSLGVYLIGCYATGAADRFSHVDVHLVMTDDSLEWFGEHWDDVLRELTGPTVVTEPGPRV